MEVFFKKKRGAVGFIFTGAVGEGGEMFLFLAENQIWMGGFYFSAQWFGMPSLGGLMVVFLKRIDSPHPHFSPPPEHPF